MYLKDLIERLEKEPNKFLKVGFQHAHSWRGSYECLAFEPCEGAKVSDMLYEAKNALGKTFEGWKGGDFVMGESTEVYLADEGNCGPYSEDGLSSRLLEYMLKDEMGRPDGKGEAR
jgi:hypothetical protein